MRNASPTGLNFPMTIDKRFSQRQTTGGENGAAYKVIRRKAVKS